MKLPSRSVRRWVTPRKCNLFATSLQVEDFDLSHRVRRIAGCATVGLVLSLLNIVSSAQTVSPDRLSALQWRLIGPYRGGRAAAVTGASDGITFYFGAVDGGIWKTIDAGITWMPVFDRQPIASIGAVEVAPSNPNILYAGTGESDIRSALSSGDGVYKSTDAGKTWANIGLKETRQISRIVIDPHNPDVVYVGALGHAYAPNDERGVFKSTDGGKHGLTFSTKVRASESLTWRLRPQIPTSSLPEPGPRIVRHGAPMRRCKCPAAESIAPPTAVPTGRSLPVMVCPMAIGDA